MRLSRPMPREVLDVGIDRLAQVGHLVDEADLGRKEGVRGVFGSSAVRRPVNSIGARLRNNGRYISASASRALSSSAPTRIGRDGGVAAPSRRNSGLDATDTPFGAPFSSSRAAILSPVPTGTVDLVTTTIGPLSSPASPRRRRRRS